MMKIQDTSLEAYQILIPEIGERQQQIYNIIIKHPNVSNLDISRIAKLPINSITPRTKELRDKGLVIQTGVKKDHITKRTMMCWSVP